MIYMPKDYLDQNFETISPDQKKWVQREARMAVRLGPLLRAISLHSSWNYALDEF